MKITERTHDVVTNEIVDIERELTEQEYNAWQADQEQLTKKALEETARVQARQTLLDKLGITAEEAQLLLG